MFLIDTSLVRDITMDNTPRHDYLNMVLNKVSNDGISYKRFQNIPKYPKDRDLSAKEIEPILGKHTTNHLIETLKLKNHKNINIDIRRIHMEEPVSFLLIDRKILALKVGNKFTPEGFPITYGFIVITEGNSIIYNKFVDYVNNLKNINSEEILSIKQ